MRRVRRCGVIVPHHLAIAVIGGDDHAAAGGKHRIRNLADRAVHRLHGADRRFEVTCMANHVGIGKIHHDQIVASVLDAVESCGENAVSAHLGLHVVGGNLRRGDHHPLLAFGLAFLAAIEEEGDMGVLLGFGKPKLPPPGGGHHLAKRVRELLRAEQGGHPGIKPARIGSHADSAGQAWRRR